MYRNIYRRGLKTAMVSITPMLCFYNANCQEIAVYAPDQYDARCCCGRGSPAISYEDESPAQRFIEDVNERMLQEQPDSNINVVDYMAEFADLSKFCLKYIMYARDQEYDAILKDPTIDGAEKELVKVKKVDGVEDNPDFHNVRRLEAKTHSYTQHAKTVESMIEEEKPRVIFDDQDIIRAFGIDRVKDDVVIGIALMYALKRQENRKEVATLYRFCKEVEARGNVRNRENLKIVTEVLMKAQEGSEGYSEPQMKAYKQLFFGDSEELRKKAKLWIENLGYNSSCALMCGLSSKEVEKFLDNDGEASWKCFAEQVWKEEKVSLGQDIQKAQEGEIKGRKVKDLYEEYKKSAVKVYQDASAKYNKFMQIMDEPQKIEAKEEAKKEGAKIEEKQAMKGTPLTAAQLEKAKEYSFDQEKFMKATTVDEALKYVRKTNQPRVRSMLDTTPKGLKRG